MLRERLRETVVILEALEAIGIRAPKRVQPLLAANDLNIEGQTERTPMGPDGSPEEPVVVRDDNLLAKLR